MTCSGATPGGLTNLQLALAELLSVRLAVDGEAWCAESVRTRDTGFRDACEANGLRVIESEVNEREDGHIVPVRVARVEWAAT
jgi:hypothetical protein